MNMVTGRKPRLVDDDDYDLESSGMEKISPEDMRRLLDGELDDSSTDEMEVIPADRDD
jgi:hypothetical protein